METLASFIKDSKPLISHSWSCGPRQSPGISSWTFWTPPFQWWAFHRMWRTRPILQAAARLWSEQSEKDKNRYCVSAHTTILSTEPGKQMILGLSFWIILMQFSGAAYPLISVSNQADCTQRRYPSLEFIHPVVEGGLGNQHHVGTWNISVVLHVTQQSNGLQSLS